MTEYYYCGLELAQHHSPLDRNLGNTILLIQEGIAEKKNLSMTELLLCFRLRSSQVRYFSSYRKKRVFKQANAELMQIIESSKISIRSAQPKDRPDIIKLEKLAIYNLCQDSYNTDQIDSLIKNIHRLHFTDEIILVAEKDCSVVGFVSLLKYRKMLRTLFVEPNKDRENIEFQLLSAIEQEAKKQKIDRIEVKSSFTEKSFYQSQGYKEIALSSLSKMDILVPSITMQKRLSFSIPSRMLFDLLLRIIVAAVPNTLFIFLAL